MADTAIGPLLGALGQLIADDLGASDLDGSLLYAENRAAAMRCVVLAPLTSFGRAVVRRPCGARLRAALREVGLKERPGFRWAALTYSVKGRRFSTDMIHPEQLDAKLTFEERTAAAVRERYGRRAFVVDALR